MGIEVIGNNEVAVITCDTTHAAFGPVHTSHRYGDAVGEMEEFVASLDKDPREIRSELLVWMHYEWRKERREQR